jgi:hypothetical protein
MCHRFPKNRVIGESDIQGFGEGELRWKIGSGSRGPCGRQDQHAEMPK